MYSTRGLCPRTFLHFEIGSVRIWGKQDRREECWFNEHFWCSRVAKLFLWIFSFRENLKGKRMGLKQEVAKCIKAKTCIRTPQNSSCVTTRVELPGSMCTELSSKHRRTLLCCTSMLLVLLKYSKHVVFPLAMFPSTQIWKQRELFSMSRAMICILVSNKTKPQPT